MNILEVFSTVNKFDIICLTESFLDSSFLKGNENLKTNGYRMVRANLPNNLKKGGVYAYIRESLSDYNFSNSYLSKRLTLEISIWVV